MTLKKSYVSIIVPVYNAEQYLQKLWDSICRQTYKELEIVFVDDGSNDNSYRMLCYYESMDSRVKLIHQSNAGRNAARNRGVKAATGEYICFIDSDDSIAANYIKDFMKPIYSGFHPDVVIGSLKEMGRKKKSKYLPEGMITYEELWTYMLDKEYFSWTLCGKMYRRECFVETDKDYVRAEDLYHNWLVCRPHMRYYYIPKSGYFYRISEEQKYIGDIGVIEILINIGKQLTQELKHNAEFMDAYRQCTLWNIIKTVREMLFTDYKRFEHKIREDSYKWKVWIERYIVIAEKYQPLRTICTTFIEDAGVLIERYRTFVQKDWNNEKLYIYGAGIVARNLSRMFNDIGVKFTGYIVSKNAISQLPPDGIHPVYNVDEVRGGTIIWGMDLKGILDVLNNRDMSRFDLLSL